MENEIERILYKAGVIRTYVGFNYFIRAVILVYEDPDRLLNTNKKIYIPIANEYHVNSNSVETALRTIRDVFMRNNGESILKDMGFEIWHKRPYSRELIEIFAAYLRKQLHQK